VQSLKNNESFFKLKKLLLFFLFALLFIAVGILLAPSLKWSGLSTGVIQATTSLTEVGSSKVQLLGRTDPPLSEEESPFVKVAEKVSPAVVNISAEKTVKGGYLHEFYPFDDFFRRFFGQVPEGKVPAQKAQSLGSGFIFRKDGYVLTNNHVVAGADNIFVKLPDGSQHKAKVVGLDKDTDIAVLKIDVEGDLPFIELGNSDALKVGEWVMAIGNPFPQLGLDRTVTVGVVSAKGRGNLNFGEDTPNYQNYIQTDASINPGNSGGPLVNIHGEVVGINSAITNPTGMAFNIGIGFAIPINLAESVIPDLIQKGKVSRGYLGIVFQELDKNTADALHLSSTEGVLVRDVQAGTPADKAGIKMRDVITAFNGQKVIDGQNFRLMVAQAEPGQEATIDIVRDGKKITEKLELADREKFLTRTEEQKPTEEKEENWLGLNVTTSTRDLANQYGVRFRSGVMVMEVDAGSLAEQAGFLSGDIIVKINDREIEDLESYQKIISSLGDQKKAILFLIYRNGEPLFKGVKTE
jgi:serine protease Do